MSDQITIRDTDGTWVVRADGAVLGESENALELIEGDYPPVIYIPRDDIAMELLSPSEKVTHCPHKGDAAHYSIATTSGVMLDAAWSYETPKQGVAAISGHLAFYDQDGVTVERI